MANLYGAAGAIRILRERFPDMTITPRKLYFWRDSPKNPLTPVQGDTDLGVPFLWDEETLRTYMPPGRGATTLEQRKHAPIRKPRRHHAG